MDLYEFVSTSEPSSIYLYVCILIISYIYFKDKSVSTSIITGIFVGITVIVYYYQKSKTEKLNESQQYEEKLKYIKPQLFDFNSYRMLNEKYEDIVKFLFSIQDLYAYNPLAYEEMVDNINMFLEQYTYINISSFRCDYRYDNLVKYKLASLNALHSIIIDAPYFKTLADKITRSHKRLNTILTKYCNLAYEICLKNKYDNGLNVSSKFTYNGPIPYHSYNEENLYSYKFY